MKKKKTVMKYRFRYCITYTYNIKFCVYNKFKQSKMKETFFSSYILFLLIKKKLQQEEQNNRKNIAYMLLCKFFFVKCHFKFYDPFLLYVLESMYTGVHIYKKCYSFTKFYIFIQRRKKLSVWYSHYNEIDSIIKLKLL